MWALSLALFLHAEAEPNPPQWPASVNVFGPEDDLATIEAAVNAAYAVNGGQPDIGQFSSKRFVFMFKPGSYNVDVPVGYYTQVLGLGVEPSEVIFTSSKGVYSEESNFAVNPGALCTFWRAAEGFQTNAVYAWNDNGNQGMLWAASQAASLRRIIVTNDLDLYQYRQGDRAAGYASGGYMSNSMVKGKVSSGSQQQYLARNSQVGTWRDGVWNEVFVGTEGAPSSHCGADAAKCAKPFVTVNAAPKVAEKPFISFSNGTYQLNIPRVVENTRGVNYNNVDQVGFEQVYVADASKDTAQSINAKLGLGLHVVLTPGIYTLSEPLRLAHNQQVLLGLGMATLWASAQGAVVVSGCGARVAGLLIAAHSPKTAPALMEWQSPGAACSSTGVMSDVYMRVGGPKNEAPVQADAMLQVDADNVVLDNSWLWRADHLEGGQKVKGQNPCQVGAIINGNDVIAYGLKAEHSLTDQVQWNGERGKTFMFQAELPYDVSQANFGDHGYTGYRVGGSVTAHEAYGVGVYHYFRDNIVTVPSAIIAPPALESSFASPLSVFLNGKGTILHVLNDKGNATAIDPQDPGSAFAQWYCMAKKAGHAAGGTCKVGDAVLCPGTSVGCQGNTCCPDGSTCPSAEEDFACCPHTKKQDCLPPSAGQLCLQEGKLTDCWQSPLSLVV
ncbi:unnamed protein product [Effrenium voratum]|nr:unnamed protein product [Effrenium voratum]